MCINNLFLRLYCYFMESNPKKKLHDHFILVIPKIKLLIYYIKFSTCVYK